MKCSLALVALSLVLSGVSFAAEVFSVPTQGEWRGYEPGTWFATRRVTHYFQPNESNTITLSKTVLIGQDTRGEVYVFSGTCDTNLHFARTPMYSIDQQPSSYRVVTRLESNTIILGGVSVPVLDQQWLTNAYEGGVMTCTRRLLADHPEFTLGWRNAVTDEFNGETYSRLEEGVPTGMTQALCLGRTATAYQITYSSIFDGKVIEEGARSISPDVPFLTSNGRRLDQDGKVVSSSSVDIVAMECDPVLLGQLCAAYTNIGFSYDPVPNPAFVKANADLLRDEGFNEWHVKNLAPDMRNHYALTNCFHQILPLWQAYQASPIKTNQDVLATALCRRYGGGGAEPELERLLLDIVANGGTNLAVRALTQLAGFCAPRYSTKLEDYLIQNQFGDVKAIEILAGSFYGNPRRVLKDVPVDLTKLDAYHLAYANPTDAVTELLRRSAEYDGAIRLEQLWGFDDDRIREILVRLVKEPATNGIIEQLNRTFIVQGMLVYNPPEAESFISKTIGEFSQPVTNISAMDTLAQLRPSMLTMALKAALELGNPLLKKKVVETLRGNTNALLALAMSGPDSDDPGVLASIAGEFSQSEVKNMLNGEVTTMFGVVSARNQPALFTAVYHHDILNDLPTLLKAFLPFYDPKKDYQLEAEIARRPWYIHRKGLPEATKGMEMDTVVKTIATHILPSYGLEGRKVLLDLAYIDRYRGAALLGFCKCEGDRAELCAQVKKIPRPRDPQYEPNPYDIALWVLGDKDVAQTMEQRLKYPPGNVGSSSIKYMPWLDRNCLVDITKRRNEIGILIPNRPWLVQALSRHMDRESWELIWEVWEETASPANNIEYARLFNKAAGRHFGLRRNEMREWIKTLPMHKE